ncbi:urease accessory protein UreF [Sporosarcina sp. YIM B06819]|uniref:urease accessory protein UreF n=1 Tax=Sporosarcina sp. YIM B06819 TaxID=3081769 RepID=UPI00298BE943|nr:urease accessory protein UreF [Sporosarcina sp. YIM B06819]
MKQLKDDSNNHSNTGATPTDFALLHLFQIHDSAFPIGSFTQTYGMETYIQEDIIRTKEDLVAYCTSFLFHNLVRGDAILIQEAYAAALNQDMERLLYLEQLCGAMKLAKESREASVKLGRQFIKTASPLVEDEFLVGWKARIDSKEIQGHYAILYGIYSATTGISAHHAVMTYLFASLNGLVQNAVRAVPFGQTTGVQAMYELIGPITEAAELVLTLTENDISNNALGIELASMKHEYLFSRLFIS